MSTSIKHHDPLDTELNAYSLRAARRPGNKSTGELMGYAATAGGLAFAGGDAMGAIQHTTVAESFQVISGQNYQSWDINGDNVADFSFRLAASANATNLVAVSNPVIGSNGFALALSPGALIDASPNQGAFLRSMNLALIGTGGNSTFGSFFNTTAYLGFRFDPSLTGTSFQYGWAKARVENFSIDDGGVRLTLSEWAWDDSGAAIGAGDTGAGGPAPVPAPATPLLTLLGLGAMGVTAYRRRREEGLKRLAEEQDTTAA